VEWEGRRREASPYPDQRSTRQTARSIGFDHSGARFFTRSAKTKWPAGGVAAEGSFKGASATAAEASVGRFRAVTRLTHAASIRAKFLTGSVSRATGTSPLTK
jgi:hypothetical protein